MSRDSEVGAVTETMDREMDDIKHYSTLLKKDAWNDLEDVNVILAGALIALYDFCDNSKLENPTGNEQFQELVDKMNKKFSDCEKMKTGNEEQRFIFKLTRRKFDNFKIENNLHDSTVKKATLFVFPFSFSLSSLKYMFRILIRSIFGFEFY